MLSDNKHHLSLTTSNYHRRRQSSELSEKAAFTASKLSHMPRSK